jgi:hypothetical protein
MKDRIKSMISHGITGLERVNASKHPHTHHGDFRTILLSSLSRKEVHTLPKIGSTTSPNPKKQKSPSMKPTIYHEGFATAERCYLNRAYRQNAFFRAQTEVCISLTGLKQIE